MTTEMVTNAQLVQMVLGGEVPTERVVGAMLVKDQERDEKLSQVEARIDEQMKKIEYLTNIQPIHPSALQAIENRRKELVIRVLGGKDAPAYKDRKFSGSVFRLIAKDIHKKFGVPRYDMIQKKDELAVIEFLDNWKPDAVTLIEIDRLNKANRMTAV